MSLAESFAADAAAPAKTSKAKLLSDVFSEEPVPLTTFVRDTKFLANPPLSYEQYNAVRFAEQIFYLPLYHQMAEEFGDYWHPVRMVNFIDLEWGKGSGKDHICRMISLRIAYLLLCLKSPQDYYQLPAQDSIHMLNIASSAKQAKQAFFDPITKAVKRGWFEGKCEPKMIEIVWDKGIVSLSGHSDAETQEGLNLILGVADEIDAFPSVEEQRGARQREPTKNAEGILKMLRTSASTRFPETFKNVRISYPRYAGSMIQQLVKAGHADIEARGAKSRRYASGPKFTWDVNPRFKDVEMVDIPGMTDQVPEVYEQDFIDDPIMAKGMYMCQPSRASNPYFRDEAALDAVRVPREPLNILYRLAQSRGGRQWEPAYEFASDFIPIAGAKYAMHGDLAVKQDKAGIAMSHVVRWHEVMLIGEDVDGGLVERLELLPEVKVDFAICFEAMLGADPPREIQIRWARQLCFKLRERGFYVSLFTFDGFQSTDSMQILEASGVESRRVSTDLSSDPWKTLRDLIYDSRVTMPDSEPLKSELLGLTMSGGGKVDHPPNGSKDIADAVACSIVGALEIGGAEAADGEQVYLGDDSFETFTVGTELPQGHPASLGFSH